MVYQSVSCFGLLCMHCTGQPCEGLPTPSLFFSTVSICGKGFVALRLKKDMVCSWYVLSCWRSKRCTEKKNNMLNNWISCVQPSPTCHVWGTVTQPPCSASHVMQPPCSANHVTHLCCSASHVTQLLCSASHGTQPPSSATHVPHSPCSIDHVAQLPCSAGHVTWPPCTSCYTPSLYYSDCFPPFK